MQIEQLKYGSCDTTVSPHDVVDVHYFGQIGEHCRDLSSIAWVPQTACIPSLSTPAPTCAARDSPAGEPGMLLVNTRDTGGGPSAKPAEPFRLQLGVGGVVRGWELGLVGACLGEHRRLRVPSALAYGSHGDGGLIPPGASLTYDVEVVSTAQADGRPVSPMPNLFSRLDLDGSCDLDQWEVATHFTRLGKPVPPRIWSTDDANRDGRIAWSEFGAPKGDAPPPQAECTQRRIENVS